MGRVTRFLQRKQEVKTNEAVKPLDEPRADPDLGKVIDVWPHLPKHIKAAIMALVATSK